MRGRDTYISAKSDSPAVCLEFVHGRHPVVPILETSIGVALDYISKKVLERENREPYLLQILGLVEVVVVGQIKVTRRRRRKLALVVQGAQLVEAVADGIPRLEELVAEGLAEDLTDLIADVDLDVCDLEARRDVLVIDIHAYKCEHAVANVVGEVGLTFHALGFFACLGLCLCATVDVDRLLGLARVVLSLGH